MKYRLITFLTVLILLAGCSAANADRNLETIKLADAKWDSLQVQNYIASKIIEEGYGYNTEIVSGSTAATIEGLRQGDIHVYMEIWTDNIRELYDEAIESGDIEKIAVNFDDNNQGLYVPTYVIEGDKERGIEPLAPDLKTVADLKDYPDVFEDPEDPGRGRIINAPSGWVVDETIDAKFTHYDLDETFNNFMPGSDAAIVTSLTSAYEKGEGWVGYYWEPTAVTAKYDLTLLEEPDYDEDIFNETGGTEFPSMDVVIGVNSEFPEQAPEITDFLEEYQTSSDMVEAPLEMMQEHGLSAEEATNWWLEEYEDEWVEWLPDDIAQKVKDAL